MQTKKCISCRKELTYDHFGLLKSSPDGYNRRCKGCANWYRRRSYQRWKSGTLHKPNIQIPLMELNYGILKEYLPGEGYAAKEHNMELTGKDVNSDMTYTIHLYKKNGGWTFKIIDNIDKNVLHHIYHHGGVQRDWLLSQVVNLLVDKDIEIQQ